MNKIRFFIIGFFLHLIIACDAYSEVVEKIKIIGNKQIQSETILSKINFISGKDYSVDEINSFQKKIFQTGFFESLSLKILNKTLIVNVVENPIIDFFYVYGDKNKDRIDKIYEILELRSGSFFSDYKLLNDISKISELYKYSGYYDVNVVPTVKKIDTSKVNISIKIDKKEQYKINRIFFIGDKVFSPSELLDVISSSESSWWKFLSTSSLLNEERIKLDRFVLKNFYSDEGYYDAQVVSSKIEILKNNKANIIFSINSGKKYSFGKINFNKLSLINLKENNDLLRNISKKIINNQYSRKKVIRIRDNIFDYLISNRYQGVDFTVNEIKKDNVIDLNISFFEKQLPVIKNILVKGNTITEEKVIRNNLIFSEGDTLSNYKISKSTNNLDSLGIFKKTNIKQSLLPENQADINIDVEEQPTGSIMGGVGVGSNETAISFSISEKNFLGKNISTTADLSIGTEKILGTFFISNPDFNDSGRIIKNNFFIQDTNYTSVGYESSVVGDDLSTSFNIYEDVILSLGIGFDYDKIKASSSASTTYKNQEGNYKTLKTFYGISEDKRDRRFQTTNGHLIGFSQSLSIPGSDILYLKNNLYTKYYKTLSKDYILNLRSGFTNINSYDSNDIKLSDRLFLSSQQLRGFEPRRIGPVDGNDHVGGNYSFYAGISSTFPNPLPEKWNATTIAFLDSGNVWGVDYDSSKDSNSLRSSFGVSLDWVSPLGPISFTLANTLKKEDTDKDQSFSFTIGSTF